MYYLNTVDLMFLDFVELNYRKSDEINLDEQFLCGFNKRNGKTQLSMNQLISSAKTLALYGLISLFSGKEHRIIVKDYKLPQQ